MSTSSIAGPYTFPVHLTPTTPNLFDPQMVSYNQNSDNLNDSALIKKSDEISESSTNDVEHSKI